jgi:NAD(P)-dependent dehydrogenase (short-subunit alcohol dehydrogenase family)
MPIRIVIVTGASRGLGLSLVQEFSTNGWKVIGTGRSEKPADFPDNDNADYRQFDASNAQACESFWKQLHAEYANAELCLVNNAGGYISGSLTDMKAEDYASQMQNSYFSAVYMTLGLALSFPKARVINVISTSSLAAHKNSSAYGAAKAAEAHFFQSLQEEFNPEQYQITNLYPSDIATHGVNPEAINPTDLAGFVRQQVESASTYYLRDVTMYPRQKENQP